MKIGVIGAGAVGAATVTSLIRSASKPDIVIIDRDRSKAVGLAVDMTTAAAVYSSAHIESGGFDQLADVDIVVVTAGVNEKAGGATDRTDARGRLALIPANAEIFREIIPQIVSVAGDVPLLIVTDPPDALADLARTLAGHDRVVSTGTIIDSLRFRIRIARELKVRTADVDAYVLGEHGTSAVFAWSTARVGGVPVLDLLSTPNTSTAEVISRIETAVRFGNIEVIEGIGASQHGIGAVVGLIVDAMLRNENAVLPVASFIEEFGTTLAVPSVLSSTGVTRTLIPPLSAEERAGLERSAAILRDALTMEAR
ncbi:lactate/malate family dehydrogenase [Subtercola frigoramans]|uniref:L-lactate dehydrogenase n=1 Tax=Subtercola frigoramans TaxID=120298 RepID=A0ABS2L307_9MICO|nr:hypothetical protein [Subtercola frigoramans]MBM7470866.1 L-lactate dehydrogenase [Subtercola frigoramans]